MSIQPKRRGRPPNSANPKTAAADETIAKTVHRLVTWGFPKRSRGNDAGVCEVVALEARRILQRVDHCGLALGPDRVEQIFEAWFSTEQAERRNSRRWPLMQRRRYVKASLKLSRPRLSLDHVAAILLSNGGQWRERNQLPGHDGDDILAPAEQRRLGELSPQAEASLIARLLSRWSEAHGPVDALKADMLAQLFRRAIGLAYRADVLGVAPDNLKKNGVEK